MAKEKSRADIHVADGAGGMRRVSDLRFEAGQWPIELIIHAKGAESWMAHLTAEIEERAWTSSGFSQLDAAENSGTLSVHISSGTSPPSVDIIWEKQRGDDLRIRARPSGDPALSLDVAREFIAAISTRQVDGRTVRAHRRAILAYEGLPWRGELWLDTDLRLGPPSMHPDPLLGPQVLILDAMVEGIGQQGVNAKFQSRVQELCVFLSFVLGSKVRTSKFDFGWVCDVNAQGTITNCAVRHVGYAETSMAPEFPSPGGSPPIERRDVSRPGLGPLGIEIDMREQWVPADIEQLWGAFMRLPRPKREQLLQAGNAHLIACSMWPDQRTAYVAFLVVACEALKPTGRRYDRMNVYDVVASLVSVSEAGRLRRLSLHPQKIRSEHLHRGKLSAGELLPIFVHDHFRDPSFDEMLRMLSKICRTCLIEWLRCEGKYNVIRLSSERRWFGLDIIIRIWRGLTSHSG